MYPLAMPAPWWSEFHSYLDVKGFSWDQTIALAWTLPLMIASCWLGRRWLVQAADAGARGRQTEAAALRTRELQMCAAWAGFLMCVNVWSIFHWLQPAHYDLKQSLPLHMCDIALLLAPLLFLTHWRPIRAIMYFWGIGLSTQAFITPTLREGIGEHRYWLFWLGHVGIVGSAIYDLVVRRFRPTIRDYITTTAITIAWYAAVALINLRLGSNYGYNGDIKPDKPTLIDQLGQWPQRAFILLAIGVVWFGVLWVIWPMADRLRGRTTLPAPR